MRRHIIELRGVEFHNKGAELMLYAILEVLRERLSSPIFVMEKRAGSSPVSKQREVGIYTKLNFRKFKINMAIIGRFIPKKLRLKYGYILEEEITTVLDGSGFAFGDFWGAKKAGERMANHIIKWKSQGKKVILLSQAFGPFTKPDLRREMNIILNNANLIFARDKYSLGYLNSLDGLKDNIHLKPDFTNLISGKLPSYFDKTQYEVAVIPNNKLLDSDIFKDRTDYVKFLINVIDNVVKNGKKPYFLIHEGEKDLSIAKEVNESPFSSNIIEILKEENPLFVKGIIGNSTAVITSRFHGLVSALSQAVPCLCVGWSHKYQALMEDYGYSEGLLKNDELNEDELINKLNMVLLPDTAGAIKSKLKVAAVQQKELSKGMWDMILKII